VETRSGPSWRPPRRRRRISTERPPHHHRGLTTWGSTAEGSRHCKKQRSGCPTPIWSGREERSQPPNAAGEELLQMPADTQPPSRSQRGSAFEPEGVRVETVDRPRLARDAKRAAAAPPPPSPPRPARKEEHTPLRRCSNSHGHHDRRRKEKQLRTGHHRQPPRRLLRAPSHCQHINQVREGAR
jgi:hypothetical protein